MVVKVDQWQLKIIEGGSMAIKDYLNIKYTHLGLKN